MSASVALVQLLAHANHLKQLPRTGWLFAGIANVESVAEHSYVTALLVLCLGEAINQSWAEEALTQPLDVGHAVKIALVHDLAEAIITDLPKRATEFIGKQVKHRAEEAAIKEMVARLPNAEETLQLWREYDQAASPEARLVKDADRLEMSFQAYCYEKQGHPDLSEFFRNHNWFYQASEHLFWQIGQFSRYANNQDEAVP